MNLSIPSRRKQRVLARNRNQRGIALATSLLLVVLLSAMSLTMVLSVGSDMLVNGYYGNERGSFYAADSGAAIARQAIVSQILAAVPATFSNTVQPIPLGTQSTVQNSITGTYGGTNWTSVTGPAGSWPEKFTIQSASVGAPTCTPTPTTYNGSSNYNGAPISCTNLPPGVTAFNYVYPYSITSVGQAQGTETTTLVDSGNLVFNGTVSVSGGSQLSFASYGTFIDQYPPCSAPFVAGTLTGPFFTNGAWNFGDANALGSSTKYDFKANTGQANGNVSFWHGGNCTQAAASSNTANGTTIAPTFEAQFNIGASSVPLPTDDYNQLQAVLNGVGAANGTAPNLNSSNLKNAAGTAYPSSGAPSSGVYVPYTTNSSGVKSFSGGGIYVAGNATVTLSPSGTTGQVYTIVQSGVTTTVTVTPSSSGVGAGTTTIQTGSQINTIQGVPTMYDSNGSPIEDATMLYVNGNITSLSGPGEYTTAINNGQAVTITASGNVTVTGDIRYAAEPVTTSSTQQVNGVTVPADTLIPANNTGQVLGIFTATGDIQMNNQQSDNNLEIDASIAMISSGGSGGWINVGNQINTLNLVGGRIANVAKAGNTITRNIFFDQRFAGGGFAPPWYPSTTVTQSNTNTSSFTPPITQRLQWYYKSSYN